MPIDIAKRLNTVYNLNGKFIQADAYEFIKKHKYSDVVQILSAFHHMEIAYGQEKAIEMLNLLDCKKLILEVPVEPKFNNRGILNASNIVSIIQKNTTFKHVCLLNAGPPHSRPIHLFERE